MVFIVKYEKREKAFVSPRDDAWLPGESGMQPQVPTKDGEAAYSQQK